MNSENDSSSEWERHGAAHVVVADVARELAEVALAPGEVLELLVRRCVELLGDVCLVRTVSDDGERLVPGPFGHRDPSALPLVGALLHGSEQRADAGLTGQVVQRGEPVALLEVPEGREVVVPAYRRYLQERGIRSMILAPLRVRDRVLGVVHVSRDRHSPSLTPADRDLFLELVERTALTYDNARLHREVVARGRLLDQLDAAVVALDNEGRVTSWNPAAERLFGYTAQEMLGRVSSAILSAPYPSEHLEAAADEARQAGWEGEWEMVRADGTHFPAWARATPVCDSSGEPEGIVGVFSDLTAERRAQQLLARRAAQHAVVAGLGERALEGGDPETLLARATEEAARVLLGSAAMLQPGPDPGHLVVRFGAGLPTDVAGRLVPRGARASLAGHALDAGRGILSRSVTDDERFALEPFLADTDPGGGIAVVIQGRDRAHGVLVAVAPHGQRFSEADVGFLQSLANVLADAIDRWRTEEEQRRLALHDPLTGLPNRTLVLDRIDHALTRVGRADGLLAILFLDLDHFKVINDGLGHGAGDELLTLLAPRLRGAVRPADTVGRFGGDEFVVVCEAVADEAMALLIARRVTQACAAPFRISGQDHHVSVSVGVVVTDGRGRAAEDLLRDADAAMYRAKERGRSRVELFDTGMRARAVERVQIERELRRGLERDELRVVYQPVVRLSDGRVTGVEALVRWQHPERGLLQPSQFIHVAEESGLVVPLGRRVLELACLQAGRWALDEDGQARTLHVNLSAQQVTGAGTALVPVVAEVLRLTRMPPEQLVLEITETALLDRGPAASEVLERLAATGVRISLDDFGTGYSSLGYLDRFPISGLKIDRSFIDGLGVHAEKRPIVDAILRMAQALGLEAVAEGVELEDQLQTLRELGCQTAQGHLFARPTDAESLAALLRRGTISLAPARRRAPAPAVPGRTAGPAPPVDPAR